MSKPHNIVRACALVLGFASVAFGDTVILKNGEKVEGRILEESDAQVTVEVKVTASIKDERVIKRAEIDKIEKVKQDEVEWPALKGLALAEESFEAADYQAAVYRLNDFVTRFPQSAHVAEAKTKLADFQAEQKRVESGEIKDGGKWLTKEQVQEERVQISGRVMLSRMKRLVVAGQLTEAMNLYDALEKNFNGSFAMPDAIDLAKQVVPRIKAAAEQQKQAIIAQKEANKKRIDVEQGAQRAQLDAMIKKQTATVDAAVLAVEKTGVRWLPLNPANERSMTALISRAGSEISVLSSKQVDKMRLSIQATDRARAAIEANDVPAAEKALMEAQTAWSFNEMTKRLQPKLADARAKAATAQTAAAEAKAKAEMAEALAASMKPKEAPKPAATETPVAVAEEAPKPAEDPLYKKPILYVGLGVLGLGAFLGRKALGKFSDPNKNLLDQ